MKKLLIFTIQEHRHYVAFNYKPYTMKHINLFYSLAAALVILGAMGKILHYSWSDTVLKISLTTEALVFVVMGVTDWVTYRREEVAALPKQEGVVADASGLESSITELNSTIKKVFNHG